MAETNYGEFVQIPESTFSDIVVESGLLLSKFDPTGATPIANSDIICATTGGVSATCVPTFTDLGEDVDNCPTNMAELKEVEDWECKLSFTALTANANVFKLALGAADIEGNKVTPRMTLKKEDFADVWLVCKRRGGGYAAAHVMNALSTAGLSLQTTKKAKAQFACELTGHFSLEKQSTVPMEWYIQGASEVA